jgi:hypothetical protein
MIMLRMLAFNPQSGSTKVQVPARVASVEIKKPKPQARASLAPDRVAEPQASSLAVSEPVSAPVAESQAIESVHQNLFLMPVYSRHSLLN